MGGEFHSATSESKKCLPHRRATHESQRKRAAATSELPSPKEIPALGLEALGSGTDGGGGGAGLLADVPHTPSKDPGSLG